MSEWWTYTLSDFLMFSPRVYYRLFELMNRELWPAPLVTLALGAAIFLRLILLVVMPATLAGRSGHAASIARSGRAAPAARTGTHDRSSSISDSPVFSLPTADRAIFAMLGLLWLWIAWSFFWERYATINWAAPYVTRAFALEGLLLTFFGAIRPRLALTPSRTDLDILSIALFAFAIAAYPLLPFFLGRSFASAEIFGIAPDPTAVATLAALALTRGRFRAALMIIPALWCVITGATLWTMETGDFFVAPLAVMLSVWLAVYTTRKCKA